MHHVVLLLTVGRSDCDACAGLKILQMSRLLGAVVEFVDCSM